LIDNFLNFQWNINPPDSRCGGDAFANRLRKNLKRILKWARRQGVTCFRVYDRDIPEFNISIDIYEINEKLLNLGFKSYGKITTILNDEYKFLCVYEINNEKIKKIKTNVAKINEDLKAIQKRKKFDI